SEWKNNLILPFNYLVNKYYYFFSKLVSPKLKIVIKNLYGEENLKYQEILFISIKICILYNLIILFLFLISIFYNFLLFVLFLIFIFIFNHYINTINIIKYEKQKKKFKNDLPAFISRLSLMINSGIQLRVAIDFITNNSNGEVVESLKLVNSLIKNGMSEVEAYNLILSRTDDLLIRKFISNIIQNIEKGGDDLENILKMVKKEGDEFRKNDLILKTQEANRKLLIPNIIIFIGILLMVMIPILLNVA
ncbi:type II secretion system F family protein, partial [Helcococcus ovis]